MEQFYTGHHRPPHTPPTKPDTGQGGGGTGGGGGHMDQGQQSAYDLMVGLLESYGFTNLGSIGKVIRKAILDGITNADELTLLVEQTPEWKQRFAGNEILRQNGLSVLSVAEYLATERSYSQILKQGGMPAGFYDDPADFAKFIGGSISPAELQARVADAADLANRLDQNVKDELQARGMGRGDIAAQFLDPSRALPLLQKKYQSILIGAAARRAGVASGTAYDNTLAELGVSEQQAMSGFQTVADILKPTQELGSMYGENYGLADAEAEVFTGGSSTKRKKLASQERAAFSGSAGTGQSSLGQSSTGSY